MVGTLSVEITHVSATTKKLLCSHPSFPKQYHAYSCYNSHVHRPTLSISLIHCARLYTAYTYIYYNGAVVSEVLMVQLTFLT